MSGHGTKRGNQYAIAILVLGLAPLATAAEAPYRVITHASTPGIQIKREVVRAIFLGELTRWTDGTQVRPVDQSLRSELRASFCESALGQTVNGNSAYWSQRVMTARVMPPPVKVGDENVLAYVRDNKGAIGYISSVTALDDGVKVLKIVE